MERFNKIASGRLPASFFEKRISPRFPFSPNVEAIDVQAETQILGRHSDISWNGCYVDTINSFAKNTAVALTVTRNSQSFKTQAKVVYSQIGMGMGLFFTTAEPEQLPVLGSRPWIASGGHLWAYYGWNVVSVRRFFYADIPLLEYYLYQPPKGSFWVSCQRFLQKLIGVFGGNLNYWGLKR